MKPAPATKKPKKRGVRSRFRSIRFLLRICAYAIAIGVFWCAYLLYVINSYQAPKEIPQADAAIILGAALWSDKPSPGLRERLEHGFELYKQGKVEHFILSGGHDHNGSTLSEAEGMRDYLKAKGVPVEAMVLEEDSRSTYENLLFSKPLAYKRGWKHLLIVTHDFHSPRAADIAQYLGYPSDTLTVGFKSQVLSAAFNQSREVLAFTKWKLDELLLRMGVQLPNSF
ncbi:vancomycin permeability regulator SanA [Paenibacillus taihuensis]|uniref:Vancomycin permeability regulator SanA n=1 Tax=Paenibacillus taihuensis TaxID=1156355 RepID=A0A3D9QBP4_9BACL|nr:YdcF family protein [Paenibacillus taihuensis]REE57367.1 vancomycin permeability regulator SanA [Paenibacillus taihuensis]